jgi:hypothetical protein
MDIDISPAPGRTPISLERGWTALLVEPLPGAGVYAVGLVQRGRLRYMVDDPVDVDELVRLLTRPAAGAARARQGFTKSRCSRGAIRR